MSQVRRRPPARSALLAITPERFRGSASRVADQRTTTVSAVKSVKASISRARDGQAVDRG
jgi:hypothetical protein